MPLFSGKKNMSKNIKTEMAAGKPQKQSIAIAYNMAKRNKKMARGGLVEGEASKKMESLNDSMHALNGDDWDEKDEAASNPSSKPMTEPKLDSGLDADLNDEESDLLSQFRPGSPEMKAPKKFMADGGMITADSSDSDELDMVGKIMAHRKMMAEGGSVDLSENASEDKNNEDDMSFDALKKENYSESDGLEDLTQPTDSNEHGHALSDADAHDMVDMIRRKLKLSRRS